jgi:hypothetical protein
MLTEIMQKIYIITNVINYNKLNHCIKIKKYPYIQQILIKFQIFLLPTTHITGYQNKSNIKNIKISKNISLCFKIWSPKLFL